ncbi:MAG: hypothetical protein EA380_02835 [Phycisphaeraceae bacterium]|nr:MAG: hypothetical protein EA380_02835 [Phycisphaeraceae bacterium]
MFKQTACVVVGVCALVGSASGALVPLAPGAGAGLSGTTTAADPVLAGTNIADQTFEFEIFDGMTLLYSGAIQTRVVQSDDTGELIFEYRLRDSMGGLNGIITNVAITGFGGWLTDVEYSTDSLGDVGPSRAERSAGDGDTLDFLMGNTPQLAGGVESYSFFALTDAPSFGLVGVAEIFIQGGFSTTVDVYAPVIPAPGALAMAGLVGLALVRRRR